MTLEILTHPALAPFRHGFFTRKGGASSGIFQGLNCGAGSSDQSEAVAINRARVAEALGVPIAQRHPLKTVDHWIECAISSTERKTLATHCFGSRPARSQRSRSSESQPSCSCSF